MSKDLYTRWGSNLSRKTPLPEYPRPQMKRDSYFNLNGLWDYTICDHYQLPDSFDGKILVPFAPESLLSGVRRQLKSEEVLWYRRSFTLPRNFCPIDGRILLHFGAVDQVADIFINGREVAHHEGGYLPFSADITDFLQPKENRLTVRVLDSLIDNPYAYGKQRYNRGGIWYTATSGIWQTVWMEAVPALHIQSFRITPDFDEDSVDLEITLSQTGSAYILIEDAPKQEVAYGRADSNGRCRLKLSRCHPWTPEDPFLYRVYLAAGEDRVESYFALRKFSTTQYQGHRVLALNNKPYFHNGVLDQGYWSDGLYTAPSDEAMIYDIQTAKRMGFNMLRKHVKIEPLRWYYHCDRLGMLVWQDMVSGGDTPSVWNTQVLPFLGITLKDHLPGAYGKLGRKDPLSRRTYEQELRDTVSLLYNCPCIAMWVPFNEGWGQFESRRITALLRNMDPSRTIDHASGWHDQGEGDLKSYHIYYRPVRLRNDEARVLALTEFGGYSLPIKNHCSTVKRFGYRIYYKRSDYVSALRRLYEKEVIPLIERQGLSAAVYTQLSDVEQELNGLLTFDRRICKVDFSGISGLMSAMHFKESTAAKTETQTPEPQKAQ